jgi:putative ABC transport system permease protein
MKKAFGTAMTGGIGYRSDLKEYVINKINASEIAKEQKENDNINIFTGMEFSEGKKQFDFESLPDEQKAYLATLSSEELAELMKAYSENNDATYESNLQKLGVVDLENPSGINIYPINFEAKEKIASVIEEYNQKNRDEGKEENVITYSDIVGTMMNSVTAIIDVISYVLIAFVSVSLIVSSIMIGIITYISVLERIKEIGILRSIGASKKDISRVFNAETLIVGLISGLLGIGITMLICIPANIIIKNVVGVSNIASLPIIGGGILVLISVLLTMIAGLIPAKLAAKKDPVEALRTE